MSERRPVATERTARMLRELEGGANSTQGGAINEPNRQPTAALI